LPAAIVLLTMAPAHAQHVSTVTGNQLLEYCESKDAFAQGLCDGYITGASDIESMEGSAFPDRRRSCTPNTVTNGQMTDVVVKYLKDHPEERHMLAAVLVVEAVTKAFPCSSPRKNDH